MGTLDFLIAAATYDNSAATDQFVTSMWDMWGGLLKVVFGCGCCSLPFLIAAGVWAFLTRKTRVNQRS